MASRLDRLTGRNPRPSNSQRFGMDWWLGHLAHWTVGGNQYAQPVRTTYSTQADEPIGNSFDGYVRAGFQANGPVFALILVRMLVFGEPSFQFENVRTGELFGHPSLSILEAPEPGCSTQQLLARMIQDADLAGNSYQTRVRRPGVDRVQRLRPDWVTIISGARERVDSVDDFDEIETDLLGYLYCPPNTDPKRATLLTPDQVAHWSPIPDPLARWRGMSWLTPVVREVEADGAATRHKLEFFNHAATPNMVVTLDKSVTPEKVEAFGEQFNDRFAGVENAYKTIMLGGGADVTVVGQSFEQIAFKATQGAGETRLAAAAGVPPVIAGFSEGLASATYSNYGQARRRFADATLHPLWKGAAHAVQTLVPPPQSDARLVLDTRHVPFLRDDAKDAAEVDRLKAVTMDLLVRAGYKPEQVGPNVAAGTLDKIEHTGKVPTTLYQDGNEPSNESGSAQPAT